MRTATVASLTDEGATAANRYKYSNKDGAFLVVSGSVAEAVATRESKTAKMTRAQLADQNQRELREEAVLGLAGTGNLGPPLQSGPGDGVGNVRHLSWLPGVWGVPGMALGVVSPGNMASALVGVCGVVGPPGYLGGPSPTQEDGVWGPPGVPGPLPQSLATGVLGS